DERTFDTLVERLGVPASADRVSLRVASGNDSAYYVVDDAKDSAHLVVHLSDGRATVSGDVSSAGPDASPAGPIDTSPSGHGEASPVAPGDGVRLDGGGDLVLTAFVDDGFGSGFSYRVDLPAKSDAGDVRALTPSLEVCRIPTRCGGEAAYVPADSAPGVFVNASLVACPTSGACEPDRRAATARSAVLDPATP
ncbi:MAG: hypothetical protein ABEJ28_11965, partial [Salinigranum sp.]